MRAGEHTACEPQINNGSEAIPSRYLKGRQNRRRGNVTQKEGHAMKKVFAAFAIAMAGGLVVYSAATLFSAAFQTMNEQWARIFAGVGIALIVGWEAGAGVLIWFTWKNRHRIIAIAALILLVLAMGLSFRYELRLHVAGQADKIAARENKARQQIDDLAELTTARKTRDRLDSLSYLTTAQKQTLADAHTRITKLENRMWQNSTEIVAETMPEASWLARMAGGNEQQWRDIMQGLPPVFWMLARVVAFPLAMFGISLMLEDTKTSYVEPPKPSGKRDSEPQTEVQKPIVTEIAKPERPKLVVDKRRQARGMTKNERRRLAEDTVPQWAEVAGAVICDLDVASFQAKQAHKLYVDWCHRIAVEPVDNRLFGKELRRMGYQSRKFPDGAHYGMKFENRIARAVRVA